MREHAFNRVIWAARRAGMALNAAKEQQLRPLELPVSHYAVLAAIAFKTGATGAEIARELGVSPQNVASLTVRLERRGLVERQAHQRHRHVLEVIITPKGEKLLDAADAAVIELEKRITAVLGEQDAEVLRGLLERLADGLDEEEDGAKL